MPIDVLIYPPTTDIRYIHAVIDDIHGYLFFNEGKDNVQAKVSTRVQGEYIWLDPASGEAKPITPSNNQY